MYQAVLFDLDGTLLNTLADLHAGVNHALAAHSLPLRTEEQTKAAVGNGVRRLIMQSVPAQTPPALTEAVLRDFRAYYAAHSRVCTAPYPGILPLLNALSAEGRQIAIVSNKFDAAVKDISSYFFGGLVPVAIGEAEERGIRKKPAPDTVLEAMKQLHVQPSDAVYIGDSEVDIETARAAALPCISVTWGFRSEQQLREAGATRLIRTASELAALLSVAL